jgi:hypothetical protein
MLARTRGRRDQRSFLFQRAQPAMTGLIDGSLSSLAPECPDPGDPSPDLHTANVRT